MALTLADCGNFLASGSGPAAAGDVRYLKS